MIKPLIWKRDRLLILDQTLLPLKERYLECRRWEDVAEAIKRLSIRGAPAIGMAGAFGLVLASWKAKSVANLLPVLEQCARGLNATRPTAVNLSWALERMLMGVKEKGGATLREKQNLILREAMKMYREEVEMEFTLAKHGARLFKGRETILTHCNTGGLATAGYGTALGVIREVHRRGRLKMVLVDETRPLLQGGRLTTWELKKEKIPFSLICDSMAGYFMQKGEVGAVIVGADRIAANGDTANKIGTYSLAVLARAHRIPFYIAAPFSTIDFNSKNGKMIRIEERSPEEVTCIRGTRIAPQGINALNPAFDITPARYITAIITEKGILRPPYNRSLRKMYK